MRYYCGKSNQKIGGIVMEYTGNAIYNYIYDENLDYYYSAEPTWMLVYGDASSIPKIMVFVSEVDSINNNCSDVEINKANKAFSIARYLRLPFIFVRFMVNSGVVGVLEENDGQWRTLTYDQLGDIYAEYDVVQPGTAGKRVNQYISSSYHAWQRNSLGGITVSDFDLIKFIDDEVKEIVELKRSKKSLNDWEPYHNDYPNFALLINTIIGSGKNIPFTLYYNLMKDGQKGMREEDISSIKVFDFIIPNNVISCNQVCYSFRGYYRLDQLLN
jgi:hypothetical protein